jgi:demethylmenaquinone methyltransferase/2-methoxy-6-polyprenyl-1,4-benzoquinol methylase
MPDTRYSISESMYKWWYDNIHSRYYNLLITWCFLPFGGEQKVRQELIEDVEFKPGERILDLCCGTGNATFVMAERAHPNADITGLDLSAGQIRVARKNNRFGNIRFIEGDATSTGFEAGSFDKVLIPHAVHEMYHDLRMRVLREAHRILRKQGQLIVLELDNPDSLFTRLKAGFIWFYWLPFNFETPTRREMFKIGLANEIAEAGFKSVEKLSKCQGVFQVVTAEK